MKTHFESIKRYRAFHIRFTPANNKHGERVRIMDDRQKMSVVIPYNYTYDTIWQNAIVYLLNLPVPIEISAMGMRRGEDHVLLTEDFSAPIKQRNAKH